MRQFRHRRPGRSTQFVAWSYSYPSEKVDNALYLSRCKWPITDVETLARETRLKTRTWCAPGENTWTMARDAVRKLLVAQPGLKEEIDVVVVASGTTMPVVHAPEPDNVGVADLAPLVLRELGREDALGVDIKACYCTGFLRGLEVMEGLLTNGSYRAGLVIATEQGSRFSVAQTNRSGFCFIMSDAAGAAVLKRREGQASPGILDSVGFTDATKHAWVGIGPDAASTLMRGGQAGPATLEMLTDCAQALMKRAYLKPKGINWLLPIQTHAGLVDALCSRLDWPREKLIWRGDVTGFSGSASIPSALAEHLERGVVRRGDLILSVAVGAGMNCAGTLFFC